MEQYIGTKIIQAVYSAQEGKPGYIVTYDNGHVSWSPEGVFMDAYNKTNAMDFGQAFAAMKQGYIVSSAFYLSDQAPHRKLYYLAHDEDRLISTYIAEANLSIHQGEPDRFVRAQPWSVIQQNDVMANDWVIVAHWRDYMELPKQIR